MEISRDAEVYDILFKSGTSFWLERFGYTVAVCSDCYDIFDNGTQPMSFQTFTKHHILPHKWNASKQFSMQSFAIILGIQKNVVLKVNVSKLFVRWMELLQCF